MPCPRTSATRSASAAGSSIITISSTASAPCARASATWWGSNTKSLRRSAGRSASPATASAAAARSPMLPPKNVGSVSTETADAPASAYSRARAPASRPAWITPRDGEARLISATSRSRAPAGEAARPSRSREAKPTGAGRRRRVPRSRQGGARGGPRRAAAAGRRRCGRAPCRSRGRRRERCQSPRRVASTNAPTRAAALPSSIAASACSAPCFRSAARPVT